MKRIVLILFLIGISTYIFSQRTYTAWEYDTNYVTYSTHLNGNLYLYNSGPSDTTLGDIIIFSNGFTIQALSDTSFYINGDVYVPEERRIYLSPTCYIYGNSGTIHINPDSIVDINGRLYADSIIIYQPPTFASTNVTKYTTLAAGQPSDGSDWIDSSNVYSSNNVYAINYAINESTEELKLNDFNFNLPSDAIITGITVELEVKCDSNNFYLDIISMFKNDLEITEEYRNPVRTPLPLTDTQIIVTGSNNPSLNTTWGEKWTPSDINDSLFGIHLRFNNDSLQSDTLSLDYVRIKVIYNIPDLLESYTKITPYGITLGTDPYLLEKDAWATIDTAPSDLSMNNKHILDINLLESTNIQNSKLYYWNQEEHNVGVVNEVDTVDWSLKNIQTMDLTDTCEITFLTPTYPCHLQLKVIHANDSIYYPVTFSNSVKFKAGTIYTSTTDQNAIDILDIYFDDTYYYITPLNDFK